MSGNTFAQLVLLCYPAFVLLLFAFLPTRKAILAGMIGGWLFLPGIKLPIVGIPDYDKIVATNCAVALGCLCFARRRLFSLRFTWIDIPIFCWCVVPSFSSLTNGLGAHDALSVGVRQVLVWFVPYCIGRAYFRDFKSQREIAIALVVGGLVYVPLCLLEVRLSPQLNSWVYGFHPNQFWRNIRFDGYRPTVFMQSGLMVGTWMATSTVIAFWLWITGEKKILGVPVVALFATLFATTVLCKALYAILLMLIAMSLLIVAKYGRSRIPAMLFFLAIPVYMFARGYQVVPTDDVTRHAARLFGDDRAQSLGARLLQEDYMIEHAMVRPYFGWGGWRRSWPKDPYTDEYALRGLDGLWTIIIGQNGLVGVSLVFATLLAPIAPTLFGKQLDPWGTTDRSSREVLSICLLIFASDCLLNGMFNPLYLVIAGAISAPNWSPKFAARTACVGTPRNVRRINGNVATVLITQKARDDA